MNDKQKIEEICKMAVMGCRRNPQAKTIEECVKCEFKHGMCDVYRVCEQIYNADYRKIDKDKVVLNKYEYEQICQELLAAEEDKQLACKKMVIKFTGRMIKLMYETGDFVLYHKVKEAAKEFGVEVEE